MAKYLKSANNGRIMPWTAVLGDRNDMLPCDKAGNLTFSSDERFDVSDMTMRDKVVGARRKSELIELGMQFGVGFDERMEDGNEMRAQLLDTLIRKGIIDPTDEDVERMQNGADNDLIDPNDDDDDDLIDPKKETDPPTVKSADGGPATGAGIDSATGEDPAEEARLAKEEAERVAAEAELRSSIVDCKKKTDVREIASEYGYDEFPSDMTEIKMKDMKAVLLSHLEDQKILAPSEAPQE